MNVEQELYLTNGELKYEIENTSGLEIVSETEDFFRVKDTLEENNRILRFNKESFMIDNEIIEDFGQDIEKYRVLECLQMLPKILHMNLRKVYILSTREHLEELEGMTGTYVFDLFNKGMYVWENGNIIISLVAHEDEAEQLSNDELEEFGHTDYKNNLRLAVWKTIARELFHSLQSNPIFEDDVEQGEEVVDDFCELFFSPSYAWRKFTFWIVSVCRVISIFILTKWI